MTRIDLFTIGHSTLDFDHFLGILRDHDISAIADVRSVPFSRRVPQFNRNILTSELPSLGIDYAYMGSELGGRTSDPSCVTDGRVDYSRIARLDHYKLGLETVSHWSNTRRVALMCTESDPLMCHRTLLVGRSLMDVGKTIAHIRSDGKIESWEEAVSRLLKTRKLNELSLFDTFEERIERAFAAQEALIAYRPEGENESHDEALHDRFH